MSESKAHYNDTKVLRFSFFVPSCLCGEPYLPVIGAKDRNVIVQYASASAILRC
jgi:hypothetical protein